MALSQVQCLDDNHINLRTNESKPDFFYNEEQRLALERLIHEGRDAFEDYIKTNNMRYFLSDLELERFLNTVEVYSPGSPDDTAELYGERDGEELSLQYWPDRSDDSIPQLDIGWTYWASYRGVTRAHVYTQPPYDGQSHIKEVVRKMIGHAQKVVAIVMDLFTDIDIFKDLLDASYRRKVAVYIILESTGVTHFLRMCDKAGMHTGHLKNLRVRSIGGAEFFSRSSKRVCGSQSQKFMFIDGDKAVSGSYSFTWSASRLDRNLITVLTGQTVEIFDRLFQDMYVMSNGVCLSKINLGSEPEPELLPQAAHTPFPTATMALKLMNPKYTLLSNCNFSTNGPVSDQTSAKNTITKNQTEVIHQIRDMPVLPPVHPGLLNLEKANMIHYVPTWPDPEPPSDVIGFINIRDSNKPLQAHLMRSELFEVSQAIRFKHPFLVPEKPLSVRACPKSQTPSVPEVPAQTPTCTETQSRSWEAQKHAKHLDQNQQQNSRQDLILPVQSPQPETVHVLTGNREDKEAPSVIKQEQVSLQSENIHTDEDFSNSFSTCAKDDTVWSDTKQILDAPQPLKCPAQTPNNLDIKLPSAVSNKTYCDIFDQPENISVKQSLNDEVIINVAPQDHRDTRPVAVNETHQNRSDTQTSNCDSNLSSLSCDDFYDCISPLADSRFEREVFVMEKPSDLQSSHNQIKNIQQEQEFPCSDSDIAQDSTVCSDDKQSLFTPKLLKMSCSIVFNFPKSNTGLSTALTNTSVQESLNDKNIITNNSTLPDEDSDPYSCAQTPSIGFNLSSTSEEYFECIDAMGFEFDTMVNVMEPSSELVMNDFNLNELHDTDSMSAVTLKIQKLTEITIQDADKYCNTEPSCQNIKEIDNPKIQAGAERQTKSQHLIEMTVNGHLKANDSKTLLGAGVDAQTSLDEELYRHHIQESEVTLGPLLVQSELLCNSLPEHELNTPQNLLEIQPKEQAVPLTERTEKPTLLDLQPELNLDAMCERQSVQLAKRTGTPSLLDLQPELNLDAMCERQSVQLAKRTGTPSLLDSQPELNLDVMCEGQYVQLAERTEKPSLLDLQPELSPDLTCEGQSVQLAERTEKPSLLDLHPELSPDLICASILTPSEVNSVCKSQLASDTECVRSLAVQDKAALTPPRRPEKTDATKSTELHNSEELQNSLADLDSGSNHPSNLESADYVNEHLRHQDGEVSQTVLKKNSEEHNAKENEHCQDLPEQFETVELLILEDSDLQEAEGKEQNSSDLSRTKTALTKEAKLNKTGAAGLKTINHRNLIENKLNLHSKRGKQTCHPTALVKQEGERVCTIQEKKNLPEAKPKLECQVRKQQSQASTRISTVKQARGELSKLTITKPHSMDLSVRPPALKAGTHRRPPGKPLGQNNPCITASPSLEKLSIGEDATLRSVQIQQRHPWTVHSPKSSTSFPKQPCVQLNGPKIRQTDQPVSSKHSASTATLSSPSGISSTRKMKNLKQTFKGTPTSKKKKE